MLGTLAKAQQVLDLYSPTQPEWGVSEVAGRCGWPPSSTHLLMSSLAQMGLLHRTPSGRYRLGFKLHRLSQILLHNTPWREVVTRSLGGLSQQTGETADAAAMDGEHLITIAAQLGWRGGAVLPARLSEEPPLHASAAGKLMLAYRTLHQPQRLPRRLTALTAQTITNRVALLAQLEEIRGAGVAFSFGEVNEDECSVAAPIFNHHAEAIAALSLTSPAGRFGEHRARWTALLVQTAREVSEQLGYWPESASSGLRQAATLPEKQ